MATSIEYMGDRWVWQTKLKITFRPTPSPTPRTILKPTFIPIECLTYMSLPQIGADDAKYR